MNRVLPAALLMMCVAPFPAHAQDTSEKPEGIICIQPECDIRKGVEIDFALAPGAAAEPLIHRVKSTPVSVFAPGVPHIEFELWLFHALEPHLLRRHEQFADWDFGNCDDSARAVPFIGPDLCVEIEVPLIANRVAKLVVGVATGHVVKGRTGWREIVPEVREIYIERYENGSRFDSVDVSGLADLAAKANLPFKEWPTVELTSRVTYSLDRRSKPQRVHFKISIANKGLRDAKRVRVTILIAIPLNNRDQKEIRRDWFPKVPAGKSATLDISARLVRGDATIVVDAAPHMHAARELDDTDNLATAGILIPEPVR